MDKFKKIIILIALSVAGYSIIQFISRIKQYRSMIESLPEYLNDIIGARPHISSKLKANRLIVEVGYPESTITGHPELQDTIRSYIDDFYDKLSGSIVEVKVYTIDY